MNPIHAPLLAKAHALDRAGKGPEALVAYREYLAREPRHGEAWSDYAGQLLALHHLEDAEKACFESLRFLPGNLSARINLACASMQRGNWETSMAQFRSVLTTAPQRQDARLGLAECLVKAGQSTLAEAELGQVIQHDPSCLTVHQLLGHIYYSQGRWPEFQAEIDRYGARVPNSDYLEFEQGFLDLLFGRMPQGWQRHEARLRIPGLVGPTRTFTQPAWRGEPFPGKTLLLCYEQGLGDTLMFVRFAPLVKALGGSVILEAQPSLAAVAATCPGVDRVIPRGDPLPEFDLHASLLSLPWLFRTELASIPADIPYLDVPDEVPHRQVLSELLALTQGRTRIGLAWAGNPGHKRDAERSIPVATLAPLTALPGVAWYSFQLGREDKPPLSDLISLAPLLTDFSATAYALSGMDLVITVDTALAHLAGALGIPTLLLLSFQPDWRWMLDRDDSPWYPSLHLYRQPRLGDWGAVIQRLVADVAPEPPSAPQP